MYRDLLTRALGKGGEGRRSHDLLLADLVDSRARLQATGAATPVAEALARELSYDGALIRMCRALEVHAAAAWFDSPVRERARLEHELLRRGVLLPGPQLQPLSSRRGVSSLPAGIGERVARPVGAGLRALSCLERPSCGPGSRPAVPR